MQCLSLFQNLDYMYFDKYASGLLQKLHYKPWTGVLLEF